MKFINELREGEKISGIYLCKHKQPAVTKNGKPYENVILQDKTGTIDAKIWEPILRELMTLTHLIILMSSEMLLLFREAFRSALNVQERRMRENTNPEIIFQSVKKALTECMKNY